MKDDPFAELDKLRKQKPLPRPITPTRICSVMPRESLKDRLNHQAQERADTELAWREAELKEQRLIQEGMEKLNKLTLTRADKVIRDYTSPIKQAIRTALQTNRMPRIARSGHG